MVRKKLWRYFRDCYREYLTAMKAMNISVDYSKEEVKPGNDFVKLLRAKVVDSIGNNRADYNLDEKIGIHIQFQVLQHTNDLVCGFNLYNYKDIHVLSSHD